MGFTKMKKLLLSFFLFFSLSALARTNQVFSIGYNKNVETYFLAELLAVDYRRTNKSFEEYKRNECRKYQPTIEETLQKYSYLKNNKIAKLTATLNDTLLFYGLGNDVMMEPLLCQTEFPTNNYSSSYSFRSSHLPEKPEAIVNSLIKHYIKALGEFYESENLEDLFKNYQPFYNGAINEIRNLIPADFINAMEKFYGEKKLSYKALVSPMMMWPIEDNEGRGIGAAVTTSKGVNVFEIMSPYVKVESNKNIDKYSTFGYDYKPRALLLTIHEFGHSFVNTNVEKYTNRIGKTDTLFSNSKLKEEMQSKGVGSWEVYIIESFVRLGEIRIATMERDYKRVDELRKYHTNTEHFIFLPLLEKKIISYEKNRQKYPKFKDFIPELLTIFEKSSIEFINDKLKKE
jgi:Domain of unknown function (DUF4932)